MYAKTVLLPPNGWHFTVLLIHIFFYFIKKKISSVVFLVLFHLFPLRIFFFKICIKLMIIFKLCVRCSAIFHFSLLLIFDIFI